jgi:hypothetical protein
MDPATIVLVIVAVVVIWLALDLLLAGGGMTSGMPALSPVKGMGGMAGI